MQKIASARLVFDRKHLATQKKKGLVQLEILYNGKRKWISTGIKLYADQWSERLHACNSMHMLEYNDMLDTLLRSAQAYINAGLKTGTAFSFEGITSHLLGSTGEVSLIDFIEERIEKSGNIRESTKKTHRTLVNALKEFGRIVGFGDVSTATLMGFDDWLHQKGYSQTTVYGYHKRLKRYINEAMKYDYIQKNPYTKLRIARGKSDGIKYLLRKEIDIIEGCPIPDQAVARARDLFIFQCYTGLAYSDMAKFDFSMCEHRDGCYVIRDVRTKTTEQYFIVLLKPAMRILTKYHYTLPVISNQKYNQYLKLVARYAGIDKPITSHWARHSYAVMALSMGVRMEHISRMLGHSSIRITESTYAKVLSSDIVADYEMLDKQLR